MPSLPYLSPRVTRRQFSGHDHLSDSSAVREKLQLSSLHPRRPLASPSRQRIKLPLPNSTRSDRVHRWTTGQKCAALILGLVALVLFVFGRRLFTRSSTLVFRREDLERIWRWEIESGHYASRHSVPAPIQLSGVVKNPALPPLPDYVRHTSFIKSDGPRRTYPTIQNIPANISFPPRLPPGSIADLDVVMDHCDFSKKKYVRDCLEILRLGAGLDAKNRIRRGSIENWKYIYVENATRESEFSYDHFTSAHPLPSARPLKKKWGARYEPALKLPPPARYTPFAQLRSPCDPESPRIFHMFWTGPFTDKPYMALLSFLYTQNTGLHHRDDTVVDDTVCRPQLWVWINPGPAAQTTRTTAQGDMFAQLKASPWAAPFLHPRFENVIQFKLWNTTEQLDGVPEIRNEWRQFKTLFNSGGKKMDVSKKSKTQAPEDDPSKRLGSKSASTYDRLSVVLSDIARFILCHRFGGIYLDADTIFLRDWEDIWGWKGAFAYRWSRLEKYNTAVLHLNKGSALGSFLFRTALRHDMDFHPMTVSKYTKDAHLEGLLLRLPDAMFDSAWLNTENYQMDRPPQPFMTAFVQFFTPPDVTSAAPSSLGFDGFFKGAYSYHFHNYWWLPFDPARNWPDLGPAFKQSELIARSALTNTTFNVLSDDFHVEDDVRDLSWATVLKRTFEAYIRGERPNMYGEWLVGLHES